MSDAIQRPVALTGSGVWVAATVIAAFGPLLVGLFHWVATYSEIPASKAPPGINLAQLRDLGLVMQAGPFSYAFVATCGVLTLAALTAIPFLRGRRRWMQVLLGIELAAVPVLIIASSGERNAAEVLITSHFGSALWVPALDVVPAAIGIVCAIGGTVLLARAGRARRAERR